MEVVVEHPGKDGRLAGENSEQEKNDDVIVKRPT